MIRIDMIRQDTRHPDKRRRHPGRAACELSCRRYEAQGPGAIYKLCTLLYLDGHLGEPLEVWDNRSPFGRPGGLAMTGRVRNWAVISDGRTTFMRAAKSDPGFTLQERELIARAAGKVAGLAEKDSPAPCKARTAPSCPPDGPEHPQGQDGASTRVVVAPTPEAA